MSNAEDRVAGVSPRESGSRAQIGAVMDTMTLSQQIRRSLNDRGEVNEGAFMGGTSFWLDDRLAIAVHGEDVLVRVPESLYPEMIGRTGARPYEFAARAVPNWILFDGGAADESVLEELIEIGLKSAG